MLKSIIRVILGIQASIALLIAVQSFINPHDVAQQLGYSLIGTLGISSFRADIGAFFAAVGLFMLWAVIRSNRNLLVPPLVLAGLALTARLVTVVQFGFVPEFVQPIAVEAITVTTLVIGYFTLVDRH